MNNCEQCRGEGLIHQGESIHRICPLCKGTGKGVESEPAEEVVAEPGESFLGEAGTE